MENNENITENTEILYPADIVLDSPSDNEVVETSTELDVEEDDVQTEFTEEEQDETSSTSETIDYTETLLSINEHVQLTSMRVEYLNCLLIVILIIILLQYVYKFFKMFF